MRDVADNIAALHVVQTAPTEWELRLEAEGYRWIAGIDEVGRGCWAGPVVAAAVVLGRATHRNNTMLQGVNDSKLMTTRQRERLAPVIYKESVGVGVGSVPAWLIDQIGIVAATRLAMEQAVLSLPLVPDVLLLDAVRLPTLPQPQYPIIRGDSSSLSIAAASVIAKTMRDDLMRRRDQIYPHGFGQHKGYGTAAHRSALRTYGLTPEHRRSFKPLWTLQEGKTS